MSTCALQSVRRNSAAYSAIFLSRIGGLRFRYSAYALVWANDCPLVGHEGQFPYRATIYWLVDAIPDATARAKIFGTTVRKLYFNGE